MNRIECDILNALRVKPFVNQRELAEDTAYSVGSVNQAVKNLMTEGYLDVNTALTEKALQKFNECSPKNAVILAAGVGQRMVPINTLSVKALLEVDGEPLIERQIKQLHSAGITEIYVVVGFMKEKFDYLIDEYGVQLIVNPQYSEKNNLHSLKLAAKYISNTYIIPSDIRCEDNPFSKGELYSWYMVSDRISKESRVRVNRKGEIVSCKADGNAMVGIAYLQGADAERIKARIHKLCDDARYDDCFWEEALYENERMTVYSKLVCGSKVAEINTYEQLRELDSASKQLKSNVIDIIAAALKVNSKEISDIAVLKKGMTNRSFSFRCEGKKYIMRIPGEGTDRLINRKQEADVYKALDGKQICDNIVYINPANGYKITEFIEGARVCDPFDESDLEKCMKRLREFHNQGLKVDHTFDIFGQIEFYEQLWQGNISVYRDYLKTKQNVLSLKPFIDACRKEYTLTHIDAVPDNFLFSQNGNVEDIRLIDWEYSGMQDPHVDIAMFCIYAMYNREQVDRLIDIYFTEGCSKETRIKIYCYIAACGLLWSNWCEFKRNLGVEFGEYSLRQYRFAKDYYRIATEEMQKLKENENG